MSLSTLCGLFGFTRQGYWKQHQVQLREEIDTTAMQNEVREIREDMPRCGVRKLQVLLEERGHRIGRDRLFDLLRSCGMLVVRKHHRIITTYSRHWMKKYSNLIKDIYIVHPNQVWVSDITYVEIYEGGERAFMYLSLITDAYTHEIVGYALHDSLDTEGPLRALKMAIANYGSSGLKGLIHHSDRGSQYCCRDYLNVLRQHGIEISMTDNGDPYENAIAERANGILKTEWLYHVRLTSRAMAAGFITKIIRIYNDERPHMSIGMMTPAQARLQSGELKKCWKNYWALKHPRQKAAGEEGPCPEPPAAGRLVAAVHSNRTAAVPQ